MFEVKCTQVKLKLNDKICSLFVLGTWLYSHAKYALNCTGSISANTVVSRPPALLFSIHWGWQLWCLLFVLINIYFHFIFFLIFLQTLESEKQAAEAKEFEKMITEEKKDNSDLKQKISGLEMELNSVRLFDCLVILNNTSL